MIAIGATNAVPKISPPSRIDVMIIWSIKGLFHIKGRTYKTACVHSAKISISRGSPRPLKVTQKLRPIGLLLDWSEARKFMSNKTIFWYYAVSYTAIFTIAYLIR